MKNGYGVYLYQNSNVYSGHWIADKKNGHGVYVYKKGNEKYDGYLVPHYCLVSGSMESVKVTER